MRPPPQGGHARDGGHPGAQRGRRVSQQIHLSSPRRGALPRRRLPLEGRNLDRQGFRGSRSARHDSADRPRHGRRSGHDQPTGPPASMPDSRRRRVRFRRQLLRRPPASRALREMHLDQRQLGQAEPARDVVGEPRPGVSAGERSRRHEAPLASAVESITAAGAAPGAAAAARAQRSKGRSHVQILRRVSALPRVIARDVPWRTSCRLPTAFARVEWDPGRFSDERASLVEACIPDRGVRFPGRKRCGNVRCSRSCTFGDRAGRRAAPSEVNPISPPGAAPLG